MTTSRPAVTSAPTPQHQEQQAAQPLTARTVRLTRIGVVLGFIAAVGLAYLLNDGVRAEVNRALAILATGDGDAIGAYILSYGVWAPVVSILLMVLQAVAAPVPAILVAFANGLAFGVVGGGLLTVFGQTLAAAICFVISRALGRSSVEALAGRLGLDAADRAVARWGARAILLARLVPGISFDVVSYAAGLTGIGFRPFVLATALGVTPQAFLYAYLIREAPQSAWLFFAASWLLIGVIGTAAIVRIRRQRLSRPVPNRPRWESVATPTGVAPCADTDHR